MKKLYCIIVTFNGSRWIEKCIKSLSSSSHDQKIIVVDNGSSDDTLNILKNKFKHVILIENKKNLGFGQANNIGIEIAISHKADFIFLLNQDAWVEENTIDDLIRIQSKHCEFGILSPIHLNGIGNDFDAYFFQYFIKSDIKGLILDILQKKNRASDIISTEFVNAAAWMISSESVLKTGLFDPIFFHYGEDINYSQRTIFWNFKIGIYTGAYVYHDREERINDKTKTETALQVFKKDFVSFLTSVCDIRHSSYLRLTLRRVLKCSYLMSKSIFLLNRKEVSVNFFMIKNIILFFPGIIKSRKQAKQHFSFSRLENL